ncbi:hypothetical protein SUDANB105_01694 [Streptomyces sp. enrichment culture]|uniref:hypothetical protein n=1 Tax=Streptomyces sp. enrichment culture TaxID=1795815 RepID=UPI003F57C086
MSVGFEGRVRVRLGGEALWEVADDTATPRLAEALAAVGGHRADRGFDIALEGFLADARRRLAEA